MSTATATSNEAAIDAFMAQMRTVALPTDAPPAARKATRLGRIEKKLDRILAILADER